MAVPPLLLRLSRATVQFLARGNGTDTRLRVAFSRASGVYGLDMTCHGTCPYIWAHSLHILYSNRQINYDLYIV